MGYDCKLTSNKNTWKTFCSSIDPKECLKHYYDNNSYPVEGACHYLCIGTKQEEVFVRTRAHLPLTTTDVLTLLHELLLQELSMTNDLQNYLLVHAQRIKKFSWPTESWHRKQHYMELLFSESIKHLTSFTTWVTGVNKRDRTALAHSKWCLCHLAALSLSQLQLLNQKTTEHLISLYSFWQWIQAQVQICWHSVQAKVQICWCCGNSVIWSFN